jgi:hypothetical protein
MLSDESENWACDFWDEKQSTYLNDTCPQWSEWKDNVKFQGRTMHGIDMSKGVNTRPPEQARKDADK